MALEKDEREVAVHVQLHMLLVDDGVFRGTEIDVKTKMFSRFWFSGSFYSGSWFSRSLFSGSLYSGS